MKYPEYDQLVAVLKKVYTSTKTENVLGYEWANYPLEVFEEVIDIVTQIELWETSKKT